ncbi:extended synaptotagmin-3-like isoform X1 [Carcharodon carcharias]|uniref:extended synaptotagmin-3-like isoform X1 n=2 Tax=Carcharodon carcharias TaxID=13397 RepID=UPI001B7F55EE|nr:extended synaptotagmin-3-like isoform X1 [Carcharodon carcharias]
MTSAAEVKKFRPRESISFSKRRASVSSEILCNEVGESSADHLVPGLMELLTQFAKAFSYLFPVYLTGYFGLSLTWIIFGLLIWIWWKRNRGWKFARLQAAFQLLEDEKFVVTNEIKQDLPAWVHFPDIERVEWLNKIVKQAWPYFGMYLEKFFRDSIEPSICGSSVCLKTFVFAKLNFGEKAPKISGVKVYTEQVDKRQVIIDLQISYIGDCEINVEVKKVCKAGLKGIQLHGTLRVILEPLSSQMPLVGAVTLFFIRRPVLEINWTGLTNLLDIPGLNELSDTKILDTIASYMVLPNRFTYPLINDVNVSQLRFPLPHGVVRIYLNKAADLIRKDTYLMGMVQGKSDPYALIRVGTQTFRSKTIKGNLNPEWYEIYEAVVHEAPGQDLEVELFDEDPDKDDFLGSLVIDLGKVMTDRVVDEWFPLNDVEHGKVQLKLEWLSLVTDLEKEPMEYTMKQTLPGQSNALLVVYLDSAYHLPRNQFEYTNNEYSVKKKNKSNYIKSTKRANLEPSCSVQLVVGNDIQESKICHNTSSPIWEQAFVFFIKNVHSEQLSIEIKDKDRECALGILTVPFYHLLKASDMTLDQRFPLEHSGPNSLIKLKMVLRILTFEEPDPDSVYTGLNALKKGPISIKKKKTGSKPNTPPSTPRSPNVPKTCGNSAVCDPMEKEENNQQSKHTDEIKSELPATPRQSNSSDTLRKDITSTTLESSLTIPNIEPHDTDEQLQNGMALNEESLGKIQLTVRYSASHESLIIIVNRCRSLISCSKDGSDPYVRLYLLPDKSWSGRRRTQVKKKTVDPQYDEKFEFSVSVKEIPKRKLDIAVKNNRSFGSHERKELGKVLIDIPNDNLSQGFTEWYELTNDGLPRKATKNL